MKVKFHYKLCNHLFLSQFLLIVVLSSKILSTLSSSREKLACTCGRISDLEQAKHGNFPWTAVIVGRYDVENEPICWGSLINNHYLLSAASCTSQFESTDIEVILNNRNQTAPRRTVSKIKNHPGFKIGQYTYDNDISLLKLREPVELENSKEMFPVCLPPELPSFFEDSTVKTNFSSWCQKCDFVQNPEERTMIMSKLSGFESDFPYLIRAPVFSKINIFVLRNETCSSFYPNRIKAQYLCGEVKHGGAALNNDDNHFYEELRSQCQDDPGSALIHLRKMRRTCDSDYGSTNEKIKIRFLQVGISSNQNVCREHSNKPVLLFTRIKRYVRWIKENTYDGAYCANSPM